METDQTFAACTTQIQEGWPTLGTQSSRSGRHFMDSSHRSAWQDLPDRYPSPSTCWRRLQLWEEEGVWLEIWRTFLATLDKRGRLDWSEAFADGSFAPAKKGGLGLVKPSGGKAQSGWWWSRVKVFLWESTWTHLLAEVTCWSRHSSRLLYRVRGGVSRVRDPGA